MYKPGDRFGCLTLSRVIGLALNGSDLWRCVCDCGKTKHYNALYLRYGGAKSCGCKETHAS